MRNIPSVNIFILDFNHLMCERAVGEGYNCLAQLISFPFGEQFGPEDVIESTEEHAEIGKSLYQYCMGKKTLAGEGKRGKLTFPIQSKTRPHRKIQTNCC